MQEDTGLADWSCTLHRRQPVEFWLVRCVQAKSDDCQLVCCHFRIWQPNTRLQSCSSTLVMFLPCSICGTESAGSPGLRAVHCKCCLWTIGAQGAGEFPDMRCIRVPLVSQFKQFAPGCWCAGHTTHSGGHSAYCRRVCHPGVFWQPHQRDLHITAAAGLLPCVRPTISSLPEEPCPASSLTSTWRSQLTRWICSEQAWLHQLPVHHGHERAGQLWHLPAWQHAAQVRVRQQLQLHSCSSVVFVPLAVHGMPADATHIRLCRQRGLRMEEVARLWQRLLPISYSVFAGRGGSCRLHHSHFFLSTCCPVH